MQYVDYMPSRSSAAPDMLSTSSLALGSNVTLSFWPISMHLPGTIINKKRNLAIHRGSYMSAHVLLNLLNDLGKKIKCEACRAFYLFFATSLINSIIQEHEC